MTPKWVSEAVFYHIYPIGFCGAPPANDFTSPPQPRLQKVSGWLGHIQTLGANALYLGPLFESTRHGYDTADYYHVDRRLGDRSTLAKVSREMHNRGMRLVLDAVFNHTGRDFWAFRDILQKGESSPYRDWYSGLAFGGRSPYGDPFTYEAWSGHYSLPRLNLANPAVREHLFQAVAMWVEEFDIDGLRLDVADSLDPDFLRALADFCRVLKPDFWLMGEVIHGDYRGWANPSMLHSVTNYEVYKSLYSSHVDRNYFELAYALNRQYGEHGIYRDLLLYNFVDNHDVDRVASKLSSAAQLYPLYLLLFGIPGVPSIYYGSEWGLAGKRTDHSDLALRPDLDLARMQTNAPQPDLAPVIAQLAGIRKTSPALRLGGYHQLDVQAEQLAFLRVWHGQRVIVAANASSKSSELALRLPAGAEGVYLDLLNPGEVFRAVHGVLQVKLSPYWGRVLSNTSG